MQIILENITLTPALYLVGTPIGNMKDITLRALQTLEAVDVVYCEDTRVTGKLLNAYGIKTKMYVYTDHSHEKQRRAIFQAIKDGQSIALVSDAGLPLVSDPGYKLVHEARGNGLNVISIPGANAALTALQISGLPTDSFVFGGFVPAKQKAREDFLNKFSDYQETLVFYETVPRLPKTLQSIHNAYGERQCVVARELTKKFEEVLSGLPQDLLKEISEKPIKGEVVLLIEGASQVVLSQSEIEEQLKEALQDMSVKEASSKIGEATGQSKKELYEIALRLKKV